jgi:hypothetical protein
MDRARSLAIVSSLLLVAILTGAGGEVKSAPEEPPRPAVGDQVMFRVDPVAWAWSHRQYPNRSMFIAASETLDHYRELDAYFPASGRFDTPREVVRGPRVSVVVRLPSGAKAVPVDEGTRAIVLELKEPDGVQTDTPAARVSVITSDLAGRVLWVRLSRLQLDQNPRTPEQRKLDANAMTLYQGAETLDRLGNQAAALETFRLLVRSYPDSAAALVATDRIAELSRAFRAPRHADATGPKSP